MATDDASRPTEENRDVDRRTVIKKGVAGAATAGVVWSAPRIQGLSLRPAYAAAQVGSSFPPLTPPAVCVGPSPAGGNLTNTNTQDGGGAGNPFDLQIQNTPPSFPFSDVVFWQTIWRDRPYAVIPNLVLPAGITWGVVQVAANENLYDHYFTGESFVLGPFQTATITGGVPSPPGDDAGLVENFICDSVTP